MPDSHDSRGHGNPNLRQFIAAFTATLSAFAVGTMIVWTAPVLPILKSGREEPVLNDEEASWVGSLLTIGAFVGCFPAGKIADLVGRKTALLALTGPMCVSWALLLFSTAAWGLYLGRLIGGFALGVVSVVAPVYIADTAMPSIRGALGVLFQLQLVFGILFMYCIGLMNSAFHMTLVCSFVQLLFLMSFVWMPETPAYLLMKDRPGQAKKSLQWLMASDDVSEELSELNRRIDGESSGGFSDLFATPVSRKAILLTLGLMFFQQGCGINAVLFYTFDIFNLASSSVSADVASIFIGIVCSIAVAISTVVIDRAGRRVLLILSAGGMALSLGILAFFMEVGVEGVAFLPVVCLTTYSLAFSIGLGPIPWIMMAELFPSHLKSPASSLTASASWGAAFAVTKSFQSLVSAFGIGLTFGFFAMISGLGVIFVVLCVPETKGRPIEDILLELGKRPQRNGDSQ